MTDLSKIKAKIAALLAKANGTDNEHEAEIFSAKAHEMMAEYQLQAFDLGEDDPMGIWIGMTGNGSTPTWKAHLTASIAQFYGCKVIRNKLGGDWKLAVHGRESARITAELMTPFIFDQCRAEAKRLKAAGHSGTTEQITRLVANALNSRIWKLTQEQQAANRAAAESGSVSREASQALAIVEEVDAYIASLYSSLKAGIARHRKTSADARDAANRVSLHRQTGNSSSTLRLK